MTSRGRQSWSRNVRKIRGPVVAPVGEFAAVGFGGLFRIVLERVERAKPFRDENWRWIGRGRVDHTVRLYVSGFVMEA